LKVKVEVGLKFEMAVLTQHLEKPTCWVKNPITKFTVESGS